MKHDQWTRPAWCETSACIEVQYAAGLYLIRNSRDPDHAIVATTDEWDAFTVAVGRGEYTPDLQP